MPRRLAARLVHRLVESAGRTTDADDPELASLTRREAEVLRLLADGLTDREIAGSLTVSPRTVETHVRKSYRKLGVHNRVQAIREAASLGVVTID
jgi:DNA-binding NarL/FixJ family response regulator